MVALLVLGLVLFIALVIVHEFGHYLAARRGGVEVEEFGIGFPPKLYGRRFKNNPTEYTINALPLGGFVRLKGEHDSDTGKGSYGAARLRTKIAIMLAGVGMNLATAWLMLTILALIGIPLLPLPNGEKQFTVASDTHIVSQRLYVSYVEPGSPAEKAGLRSRDIVWGINGYVTTSPGETTLCSRLKSDFSSINCDETQRYFSAELLRQLNELYAGQTVSYLLQRSEGGTETLQLTLRSREEVEASRSTDTPKGYVGIVPYDYTVVRSGLSAPVVAGGLTYQFSKLTLEGIGGALKNLVTGKAAQAGENVSGPVGIFFVLKDGSTLGFRYVLLIIALLSLTLAIMNVLPIPALDGGRLFVTLLFRYLRRPLSARLEERIHGTGFAALMLLFVVITIVDVRRFF